MAQVKFYSVASLPETASTTGAGGVYFVDGGELYKGSSRFGANRIWTSKPEANAGVIGGDLYINAGVTEVFDGVGKSWVSITNTNGWTSVSFGGEGSYIQAVSQGTDGAITATAVAFPTLDTGDNDGEVKLGSDAAKVSGWDTLVGSVSTNATNIASVSSALGSLATTVASVSERVGTLETKVSGIEGIVDTADGGTVTASSGVFTNLTVSDTATFNATTVSASTLTVGGKTVNEIAQSEIATSIAALGGTSSSSSNGITVGVTTSGGEVTTVTVNATTFGNVMHFRDTVSNTSDVSDPVAGDIVLIAGVTDSSSTFVNGQEYIYTTTSTWELIGDQSTYAIKSVVDAALDTKASVGTGTATASYGVSGEVVLSANAQPTLSVAVAPVTTSAGITSTATTSLATAAAIADYVDGKIGALDSTVSASENTGVQVQVTQADGVVTGVTADLVWLGADGNALA